MARANRALSILAAFCLAATLAAGETPVFVPDSFNPSAGRMLQVGEWVEYLVAFPIDPLENSLAPNPVPPPVSEAVEPDPGLPTVGEFPFQPVFDPPEAWLALPLRLEVIRVDEEGLQVRLTFEGMGRNVFLPLRKPDWGPPFRYEAPQPEDTAAVHVIAGVEYRVTVTRRRDPRGGYVRLGSPDLPFGLARFATENVDIALVGMGEGQPPAFPLAGTGDMSPPPGVLYKDE